MEVDHIDLANKKTLGEFLAEYLPPRVIISNSQSTQNRIEWSTWTHPITNEEHQITLHKASALSTADFEACFKLIELTSSQHYKKSEDGWNPKAKKKEMRLLDLKYLLVKCNGQVLGYVSLMPTYEDGYAVIYCYEIHLASSLQGTGLGKKLMTILEVVAEKIPGTEKVMLTSFLSNERAVQFYRKLGYCKDEFSPTGKLLRDGTRIEPSYVILSKVVRSYF